MAASKANGARARTWRWGTARSATLATARVADNSPACCHVSDTVCTPPLCPVDDAKSGLYGRISPAIVSARPYGEPVTPPHENAPQRALRVSAGAPWVGR